MSNAAYLLFGIIFGMGIGCIIGFLAAHAASGIDIERPRILPRPRDDRDADEPDKKDDTDDDTERPDDDS